MLYSIFLFVFSFCLGATTALGIAAALVYYFLKLMEQKYMQHITTPSKQSEDSTRMTKMQDITVRRFLRRAFLISLARKHKYRGSSRFSMTRNAFERSSTQIRTTVLRLSKLFHGLSRRSRATCCSNFMMKR